ncbi:MAG: hypothetical protein M3R45_09945 [Pseudomonadota bacterium]|nr:hypothetical protein [Pseudomonadota bacterium]
MQADLFLNHCAHDCTPEKQKQSGKPRLWCRKKPAKPSQAKPSQAQAKPKPKPKPKQDKTGQDRRAIHSEKLSRFAFVKLASANHDKASLFLHTVRLNPTSRLCKIN